MALHLWEAAYGQQRALLHQGRWSYTTTRRQQCSCTFTTKQLRIAHPGRKEMARSVFSMEEGHNAEYDRSTENSLNGNDTDRLNRTGLQCCPSLRGGEVSAPAIWCLCSKQTCLEKFIWVYFLLGCRIKMKSTWMLTLIVRQWSGVKALKTQSASYCKQLFSLHSFTNPILELHALVMSHQISAFGRVIWSKQHFSSTNQHFELD